MSESLHSTTGPGMGSWGPSRDDNPADADAIVREIQRPNQYEPEEFDRPDLEYAPDVRDRRHLEGRSMPAMELPGFGPERDTCGQDWFMFCECCGESVRVGQTCRESRCSRCAQDWCRRAASAAHSKLKALWAYKMGSTSVHQFFHHVTISLPTDWALSGDPETVFSRTKDVIKAIMDEFGLHGIPVYHPYRGSNEEPGDDMGEWSKRVFNHRNWDDVKGELRFSPHWHIIGVAPYFDIGVTEQIEAETGWVVHRITKSGDSNVSIGNDWDLARVVSYCLSHCGVYETDSGNSRAAYYPNVVDRARPGKSKSIVAGEEQQKESDQIVRSVVPKTLGIEYHSVACGRQVPLGEGAEGVSLAKAVATSGEGEGDGGGDDQGDDLGPDSPEETPDPGETEACEGRMLGIDKAPDYLSREEWRDSASKSHELEETYREFLARRGVVT